MKQTERTLANIIIQIMAFGFLLLYGYLSRAHHNDNIIWLSMALLLGIIGFFRQLPVTLLTAIVFMTGFGGVILYRLYFSHSLTVVSWNEVIWLLAFPFFALIGGLNKVHRFPRLKKRDAKLFRREEDDEDVEEQYLLLDEELGIRRFPLEQLASPLETFASQGLVDKYTFTLLLIKIQYFRAFRQEYGDLETTRFLNLVASMIVDIAPEAELKAYMNDGLFALVLTGKQSITAQMAQLRLDNKFESMLLSRSRSDGYIRVRLAYGIADFPIHGMNGDILIEKARKELQPGVGGLDQQ